MPADPQPQPNDQQPVSDTPDTGMHTERLIRSLNSPDHTRAYFTEMVSRQSPRFQALSPVKRGTPYDYGHAGDLAIQAQFPNLRFLKEITPARGGEIPGMVQEEYVIWLWGTDGDAEDTFNAEVTYLAESTAHPIYARTSTIRREVYEANPAVNVGTPLTALVAIKVTAPGTGYNTATVGITGGSGSGATAEAVLNNAGAIDHIVVTNEGSGYTSAPTVTITGDGTGATAQGIIQPQSAVLVSQKKSELPEGDPQGHEYVSVLRVYSTLPGPQLLTKSIGQDNLIPAKYRRLVTHVVTEQDVAASYSMPSSLTGNQTQVELAMKTIAEARLKILEEVIASGSSLNGQELGEWGTVSIAESIVDDGSAIDSGFLVITSKVDPLGNGKSIKITASVASYPQTVGQDYDDALDLPRPYTQDIVAAGTVGTAHAKIEPMDSRRSRKRTFDLTAIHAYLDAYQVVYDGSTNLHLPDVLLSIDAIEAYSNGAGSYNEAATGLGSGTTFFLSMNTQGSGQGSAGTMIELAIETKQYWARNIGTKRCMFFIAPDGDIPAKIASVLGAAVSAWPKFQPQGHTIVAKGEKISGEVRVRTGFQQSSNSDGSSVSDTGGKGKSFDVTPSVHAVRIPPMLHDSITVGGDTDNTHLLDIGASASDPVNGTLSDYIDDEVKSSVSPSSFSATSPTGIPSSGHAVVRTDVEPYSYGRLRVHAEVVNWADVV